MKKKIYLFSEAIDVERFSKISFVEEAFEIIPFQNLNAEEALKKKFDFIELGEGDFEKFKPFIKAVNWKTSHIGVADTLFKVGDTYLPQNLVADCIFGVLKDKNFHLNTAQSAMVIGSYDFVLSVAAKVALSGFAEIIISLSENNRSAEIEKKIREFIFNLNLKSIRLNELTQLQTTSGILISNVSEEMDPESFESLTYFNFLLHGAVFVDFQSLKNSVLMEEAKRAELNVVEELEILTLKYKSMIEFCKNSSFV